MNDKKRHALVAIWHMEQAIEALRLRMGHEDTGFHDGKGWVSTSSWMIEPESIAADLLRKALDEIGQPRDTYGAVP